MPITHQKVSRLKQKLDRLFELARDLPLDPIEIQSHWARYLCIQTSGFLETAVQIMLLDYTQNCSNPRVYRYASVQIKRFQNPKFTKIEALLLSFDQEWSNRLRDDRFKEIRLDIGNMVELRNNIAHGDDTPTLRVSRMKEYYASALQLVEELERLLALE